MSFKSYEYTFEPFLLSTANDVKIVIPPMISTSTRQFGAAGWSMTFTHRRYNHGHSRVRFHKCSEKKSITFHLQCSAVASGSYSLDSILAEIERCGLSLKGLVPQRAWTESAKEHSFREEINRLDNKLATANQLLTESKESNTLLRQEVGYLNTKVADSDQTLSTVKAKNTFLEVELKALKNEVESQRLKNERLESVNTFLKIGMSTSSEESVSVSDTLKRIADASIAKLVDISSPEPDEVVDEIVRRAVGDF